MIRYLLGILLVQAATVALVLLLPNLDGVMWLRLVIPLVLIACFGAFWFASIAQQKTKDELHAVTAQHAREKEKLQINAERAKTRLVQKTQKQITRETNLAHKKANFKVGAAFAGAAGFGVLLLLTELLTLGLLTISTAGGALGGYLYGGSKTKQKLTKQLEHVNNLPDHTAKSTKNQKNKEKQVIKVIKQ